MMSTHLRRLLLGLGLALGTACTPAPNILPTNDLNRPTDITFMCLGAYGQPGTDANGAPIEVGPNEVTGQPMRICHPPAVNGDHQDQPIPTVHNRTFAFVPNSASGDLTVIDADNWKLVDLNKSTAGFGRVPLGSREHFSTGSRLISRALRRLPMASTWYGPSRIRLALLSNPGRARTACGSNAFAFRLALLASFMRAGRM